MPERGRYSGQKKYQKKITTGSPPTVTKAHNQPRTNRRTHPQTHGHTHQAIHPPTMCYSSTAITYSSRCVSSSYAALHRRVVKAPWVQKTKLHNTSPTHSQEPARPPTHAHLPNQPSRTSIPTHNVLQQFSSKYSSTCVANGTCRVYRLSQWVYPPVSYTHLTLPTKRIV